MRNIKKTVTITTARVFKPDFKTKTFEQVGKRDYLGGKGERLVKSELRREFGSECMIEVENAKAVFEMPADVFFKYATRCESDAVTEV